MAQGYSLWLCRGIVIMAVMSVLHITAAPICCLPPFCPKSTATGSVPFTFRPNPARVFPICVGKDPETGKWDDEIVKLGFHEVFDSIDKTRNKDQDKVTPKWDGFRYDPYRDHMFQLANTKGDVDMITQYLSHVYKPGARAIMDNWVHLEFFGLNKAKGDKPIVGLYVQAIQGPLGIPFGEFVNMKFTRGVYPDPGAPGKPLENQPHPKDTDYDNVLSMYPCTFYAKAGVKIPEVLMWSNKVAPGTASTKYKHFGRLAVNFKWDENACAEVAFFQLIIIVVYDFKTLDYRVGLSHVMFPGRINFNTNGLAYPHYPDWGPVEVITTTDKEIENDFAIKDPGYRQYRIVSNLDYEHCVQHHVGVVKKGPQKGACPPGPFRCLGRTLASRPESKDRLKTYKEDMWKKWWPVYLAYNTNLDRLKCVPTSTTTTSTTSTTTTSAPTAPFSTTVISETTTFIPPIPEPTTTTTRKPNKVDNQTIAAANIAKKIEKKKVINHGDLCVFIWFVLIPVANFLARFFKDFNNWAGLGVGFWIIAHVLIHHAGVLLMWISFGLVVSNGISFFGGAPLAHYIFGFPAAFIQHFELFKGFIRDSKAQVAYRQSLAHAINGYVSGLLCLCCAGSTHMDELKACIIYALYVITLISIVCGNCVERKIATSLGAYPPRKVFPVLERFMMAFTFCIGCMIALALDLDFIRFLEEIKP